MSTPAAKRRRIDAASSTLSKPFRSPVKTPLKSPLKTDGTEPATPSNLNSSFSATPAVPKNPAAAKTAIVIPPALKKGNGTTTPRPARAIKAYASPRETAALNADPDIAPLLKVQRELEKQLKDVKAQLEAAEQAKKIESQAKDGEVDGELVELVEKWTGASRQAAEELFAKVRDRVNRMGGPRAWKEAQKKQEEFRNGGWEEENTGGGGGDDSEEEGEGERGEKRDVYAEYGLDLETENEKSQREKGVGDTGEMPGQEDVCHILR